MNGRICKSDETRGLCKKDKEVRKMIIPWGTG